MSQVCLGLYPSRLGVEGVPCTVLLTAGPEVTKALKLREGRAKGHRGRKLQSATVNSDQETLQGASQAAEWQLGCLAFGSVPSF